MQQNGSNNSQQYYAQTTASSSSILNGLNHLHNNNNISNLISTAQNQPTTSNSCCGGVSKDSTVDYSRILAPTLKSTPDQMRNCISIDLLTACQREVNFLRMIDRKAPVLYEPSIVENAIRRYEMCWLPAQAAKPDLNNIPPLDVHWIWHIHMLSPTHYVQVSECV